MSGRQFKGVTVMPGTRMAEFLDKGNQKSAEKLLKCLNRMSDAAYDAQTVNEVIKANPDLF